MSNTSTFIFNDGGRSHYFKGRAGDCATRAMSIALELDYKLCYDELAKAHSAKLASVLRVTVFIKTTLMPS